MTERVEVIVASTEADLPGHVYVAREQDGKESYVIVRETPGEHAEDERAVLVGEYQFVRYLEVSKSILVRPAPLPEGGDRR